MGAILIAAEGFDVSSLTGEVIDTYHFVFACGSFMSEAPLSLRYPPSPKIFPKPSSPIDPPPTIAILNYYISLTLQSIFDTSAIYSD